MASRLDRFKKRQGIKSSHASYTSFQDDDVNSFLNSEVDSNKIEAIYKTTEQFYDMSVSDEEAKEFLLKFQQDFNDERFTRLISDCRKEVIKSIVTPFGIGRLLAAYDKTGGNVTTVHNANQKIYANTDDEYKREDYTNTKNSDGEQFAGSGKNSVGSNFTKSKMDNEGNVVDAYTGKTQSADTTSPDHIESLSQHHKDGGFMQNSQQKADFATDEDNLALTDRSVNQSMRDYDKKEWSEKEKEQGIKNKDRFDIDTEKLDAQVEKGKSTSERHLPSDKEKAQYYTKESAITGMNEGAKMGMQQALGIILTEFFTAVFDELFDIYKNGFTNGLEDDKFFLVLKDRLKRIATRIKDKWKDAAIAFKDGFISGFISNLATTVINMFVTTGKRLVRIIREGMFSLFRAVKLLLYPPEGMSTEDAMHEANKLIASGLIISLGVMAEEYIEKIIASTTILSPFATILTSVLVGAITGLSVTMAVYYLDKRKNDKEMVTELVNSSNRNIDYINNLFTTGV